MNIREIEDLLQKYFDGDTSLDEERRLREFFHQKEIPENLKCHLPLFQWIAGEQQVEITGSGFEERLNQNLRTPLRSAGSITIPVSRGKKIAPMLMAASILVLIGLLFSIRFFVNDQVPRVPPSAEMAYAQTQEALTVLSANFNVGLSGLEKLSQFDKATNQLESFGKFFIIQSIFINPDEMAVSSKTK